jgi:hypothetical protein
MNRSKRRPPAHVSGDQAIKIVERIFPPYWVARKYHPDYGIDLGVELFEQTKTPDGEVVFDTLGEHLFLQVKGTAKLTPKRIAVASRPNANRPPPARFQGRSVNIDVFEFRLESTELVTVQRMGASLPVLLVLVELSTERAFFVCLNDYIDKILLPSDPKYAQKDQHIIRIPAANELAGSVTALSFYAKRPKLYAAFQTFTYQHHELEYTRKTDLSRTSKYFAERLLQYDFWSKCEAWGLIERLHQHLQSLLKKGVPGQLRAYPVTNTAAYKQWVDQYGDRYALKDLLNSFDIRALWASLSNVGNTFEEICREWFLPTFLGWHASYSPIEGVAPNEQPKRIDSSLSTRVQKRSRQRQQALTEKVIAPAKAKAKEQTGR